MDSLPLLTREEAAPPSPSKWSPSLPPAEYVDFWD